MIIYQIRVEYKNGSAAEVLDVEEFVAGYKYMYLRTKSSTLSFNRSDISNISRRVNGEEDWIPILMKKPKYK